MTKKEQNALDKAAFKQQLVRLQTLVDDAVGNINGPMRDAALLFKTEEQRKEAIQVLLTVASAVIEAAQLAGTEHGIEWSFLDLTMRYPEYEYYDKKQRRSFTTRDQTLAKEHADEGEGVYSMNGLDEPKLASNDWWDSSSRNC